MEDWYGQEEQEKNIASRQEGESGPTREAWIIAGVILFGSLGISVSILYSAVV